MLALVTTSVMRHPSRLHTHMGFVRMFTEVTVMDSDVFIKFEGQNCFKKGRVLKFGAWLLASESYICVLIKQDSWRCYFKFSCCCYF